MANVYYTCKGLGNRTSILHQDKILHFLWRDIRPRAMLAACTGVNFKYRESAWISIKSKFTGRAFFFLNVARLIWRYFATDSSDRAYLSWLQTMIARMMRFLSSSGEGFSLGMVISFVRWLFLGQFVLVIII